MLSERLVLGYKGHAVELVKQYIAQSEKSYLPLHIFSKKYFKQFPKLGKRDRRSIIHLTYAFFRLGNLLKDKSIEERIDIGVFLCDEQINDFNSSLLARFSFPIKDIELPLTEKWNKLHTLYPGSLAGFWGGSSFDFSEGLKADDYTFSLFKQPSLFIRARAKRIDDVLDELKQQNIDFHQSADNPLTIQLPQGTNVELFNSFNKGWIEVQDLSSQLVCTHFNPQLGDYWWDVCAASGGKSLALLDKQHNISIFATDVRKPILENYSLRLKRAGFGEIDTLVADLTQPLTNGSRYNHIICDVPCSGSGTWARTPDAVYFFDSKQLTSYHQKQVAIAVNASKHLKKGGSLFYITCSVFKQENESSVKEILAQTDLAIKQQQLIIGYPNKADTMFFAEFVNE